MLCLECFIKSFLIALWNLHVVKCHVHEILCYQSYATFCCQLCLEAVAVVEIAVMLDRNILVNLNAVIHLSFSFSSIFHVVHEIPAVSPQFTTKNVTVEIVGGFCQFNSVADISHRFIKFFLLFVKVGKLLQSIDFLFNVLTVFFVRLYIFDAFKKLNSFIGFINSFHGEELSQSCTAMPIFIATAKEMLRWVGTC